MYAIPPTPMWGGSLQKNILTLEKKERPALEGDTFNSYPNPPLQQPCSSFFIYSVRYKSEIADVLSEVFPFEFKPF